MEEESWIFILLILKTGSRSGEKVRSRLFMYFSHVFTLRKRHQKASSNPSVDMIIMVFCLVVWK